MSSFAPTNLNGANNGHADAFASRTSIDLSFQNSADRKVRGPERQTSSRRSVRNDHGDWLQEQAIKRSRAQIADATGLTPRGAENIRLGESKISFDALVELCRNDPLFRAEFFKYCGGHLEASPAFYAHLSRAFSEWQCTTQQGMAD